MQRGVPKLIGTVNLQENDNVLTQKPWGRVTIGNSPFSVVAQSNGFMFAYGSACGSLASVSIEGWKYVSDVHYFRRDGNGVDVDRYLGSITPTNTLAILKIPSGYISYHHLKPTDPIICNLPVDKQKQVLGILGTQ
jgi:hypothetical protein